MHTPPSARSRWLTKTVGKRLNSASAMTVQIYIKLGKRAGPTIRTARFFLPSTRSFVPGIGTLAAMRNGYRTELCRATQR